MRPIAKMPAIDSLCMWRTLPTLSIFVAAILPSSAAELSGSMYNGVLREIHGKGCNALVVNVSDCELINRSSRLSHVCGHNTSRLAIEDLLITGIGRSGTTFVQRVLAKLGLPIRHDTLHDQTEPDLLRWKNQRWAGAVSWPQAFDVSPFAASKTDNGHPGRPVTRTCPRPTWTVQWAQRFRRVVHLMREPLSTIRSRDNQGKLFVFDQVSRCNTDVRTAGTQPLTRQKLRHTLQHYVLWNSFVEATAHEHLRIEDSNGTTLLGLLARANRTLPNMPTAGRIDWTIARIGNETNSGHTKKLDEPLTWAALTSLDPEHVALAQMLALRHNYEIADLDRSSLLRPSDGTTCAQQHCFFRPTGHWHCQLAYISVPQDESSPSSAATTAAVVPPPNSAATTAAVVPPSPPPSSSSLSNWTKLREAAEFWPRHLTLGFTSTSSARAPITHRRATEALATHAPIVMLVNFYDVYPSSTRSKSHAPCEDFSRSMIMSAGNVLNVSTVPGAKPLAWVNALSSDALTFWMTTLYRVVSRQVSHIWLIDDDLEFGHFELNRFMEVAIPADLSIMQPSIRGKTPQARSTDHEFLRYNPRYGNGTLRQTCFVETQTPFFTVAAWIRSIHPFLARLPAASLGRSTGGVSHYWCRLVHGVKGAPGGFTPKACAVINIPITHNDARTINSDSSQMARASSEVGLAFKMEIEDRVRSMGLPACHKSHGQVAGTPYLKQRLNLTNLLTG